MQAPASSGSNNQIDRLAESKLVDAEAKDADELTSGGGGVGGGGGGGGGGGSGGGAGLVSSLSDFRGFDFELDGLEGGGDDEELTLPSLLTISIVLRHVLSFLPWSQRGADLLTVSTDFLGDAPHASGDAAYWSFMCQHLSEGAGVYFAAEAAADLADQRGSMRNLFLELWPLRRVFAPPGLFSEPPEEAEAPPIRLQAMMRFRPGKHGPVVDTTNMALPFHQRLNILKVSECERCVGARGLGRTSTNSPAHQLTTAASAAPQSEQPELSHVQAMQIVMKEQAESGKSELPAQILGVTPGPNGSALTMSPGTGLRTFNLDHVFPSTTTQADIFASTGLPTVWEFLNGTNGAGRFLLLPLPFSSLLFSLFSSLFPSLFPL